MDLKKRLAKEGDLVTKAMQSYLGKGQPSKLYEAVNHLPFAGGKRLRPVIALLSCEAVGGRAQDAMPYGVALELIHTFTLVHDDFMDNDEKRRGLPAVHTLYGKDTAILNRLCRHELPDLEPLRHIGVSRWANPLPLQGGI